MDIYENMIPFPHILTVTIKDWMRFWSLVESMEEGKCWNWKMNQRGGTRRYGIFRLQGEYYVATRVSYFLHNKKDPGEYMVLHSCNNTYCVNPTHLSLGTQIENQKYSFECGLSDRKGENHPGARFNEEIVREIRNSKLSHAEEGRKHGVDRSVIYAIRSGKRWSHVSKEIKT